MTAQAGAVAAHSVMYGLMVEGDFTKDTITFHMKPGYYMAAGEYLIAPAKDFTPPAAVPVEALEGLVADWEARARSASPCDAMLINKHVRELSTLIKERSNGT